MADLLSKDRLLALSGTLPRDRVRVSGGEVIVQGLTGTQRDAYEAASIKGRGKKRELNYENLRARLVALCCIHEDGSRMFADADVPAIGQLPATVVEPLFDAARRLSGLTEEDVTELGEASGSGLPDSSRSGSPASLAE